MLNGCVKFQKKEQSVGVVFKVLAIMDDQRMVVSEALQRTFDILWVCFKMSRYSCGNVDFITTTINSA